MFLPTFSFRSGPFVDESRQSVSRCCRRAAGTDFVQTAGVEGGGTIGAGALKRSRKPAGCAAAGIVVLPDFPATGNAANELAQAPPACPYRCCADGDASSRLS